MRRVSRKAVSSVKLGSAGEFHPVLPFLYVHPHFASWSGLKNTCTTSLAWDQAGQALLRGKGRDGRLALGWAVGRHAAGQHEDHMPQPVGAPGCAVASGSRLDPGHLGLKWAGCPAEHTTCACVSWVSPVERGRVAAGQLQKEPWRCPSLAGSGHSGPLLL